MADPSLDAVLRAIAAVEGVDPAGIDLDVPMHQVMAPGPDRDRRLDRIWRLAAAEVGVAVKPIWAEAPRPKPGLPEPTMASLAALGAVSVRARALLAANSPPEREESPASIAESLGSGRFVVSPWRGGPMHLPWSGRRAGLVLAFWLVLAFVVLPSGMVGGRWGLSLPLAFGIGAMAMVLPLAGLAWRGLWALWRAG